MERWFEERRKNKVLDLAYRQITLALDTVTDLERAVKAATAGDEKEAKITIERLFKIEEEIDNLRRSVFEELTKGSLLLKDREDIMHLVKRLDVMADHVKDSARNVLVVINSEIPKELWEAYSATASIIVNCASTLRQSLKLLGENPSEARTVSFQVEEEENKADAKYLEIKSLLIKYGREVNPSVLILLKDLAQSMEEVADSCADTADYVRILTVPSK